MELKLPFEFFGMIKKFFSTTFRHKIPYKFDKSSLAIHLNQYRFHSSSAGVQRTSHRLVGREVFTN